MLNLTVTEKIYTHNGIMHADDVISAAMLLAIKPTMKIIRTNNPPMEDTRNAPRYIVFDVGRGKYDHHQPNCRIHVDTNLKYAACTLLFEDIWEYLFPDSESAAQFRMNILEPIQNHDNGVYTNGQIYTNCVLNTIISQLNPVDNDVTDEERDQLFKDTVNLVIRYIVNPAVNKAKEAIKQGEEVLRIYNTGDPKYCIMDKYMQWQKVLSPIPECKFVIYPSNRNPGDWNIQIVHRGDLFPEEWSKDTLENCTFCHTGRFLASFSNFDSAVRYAEEAII